MYLTLKYIHTFRFCIRSFRNRYDWSFLYKQLTNLHDLEIVENNFTQRLTNLHELEIVENNFT